MYIRKISKGSVSQIIGAVVDVRFKEGDKLPQIYDALRVKKEDGNFLILEVQQDLGENTVRTIAMDSTDSLQRGLEVENLGQPIAMPVGEDINGRLFNVIGNTIDGIGLVKVEKSYPIHREPPKFEDLSTSNEILYTGIKVIDLIEH